MQIKNLYRRIIFNILDSDNQGFYRSEKGCHKRYDIYALKNVQLKRLNMQKNILYIKKKKKFKLLYNLHHKKKKY